MKRKDESEKSQKKKKDFNKKSKIISIDELHKDPLFNLASKNWENLEKKPKFDIKLVSKIYKEELSTTNMIAKAAILEISRYLENYLWPNYTSKKKASKEHLISIMIMINQKHNDKLKSWGIYEFFFFLHLCC